MLVKSIQKVLLLLISLFYCSISVASLSWPACSTTMDISGLPTSSVGVTANTPVSWDLVITGGSGFDAETYSIAWLNGTVNGTMEENWTYRAGHVAHVTLTYTPNSGFEEGDIENLNFKVVHGYGECLSASKQMRMHEESCNGAFEILSKNWSSSPKYVNWGASRVFRADVHTWDAANTPDYNIVLLGGSPNLGSFSQISDAFRAPGRRLRFRYEHDEGSSGNDTVRFRIEDNAISDASARESCGVELEIPIIVKEQPEDFYCSGLGGTLTAVPSIIDEGGTSTITVQGLSSGNSSGNYTYTVIGSLEDGAITSGGTSESASTTGSKSYVYTHDGDDDGGDTISVKITDALHPECSVVRNVTIEMINYCATLFATVDPVAPIAPGSLTSFTVNVVGGSGKYKFRVVSALNNGEMVGHDTGWQETNAYEFNYQHYASSSAADIITIEIEDKATDCTYIVQVPIQLINYCDGFGIGEGSVLLLTMDPGDSGIVTINADVGAGSGQFIYNIETLPTQGTVSPHNSGVTTASSFDFLYQHNGSEFTDSFVVSVQDAVYTQCIEMATVNIAFIDYCETFSRTASPASQTISIGGSYSFSVAGSGGSGQYRYTLTTPPDDGIISSVTLPDNGTIVSATVSESTGPVTFGYTHDPSQVNDGDVMVVRVEDMVYGCSALVNVYMNMEDNCPTSYSISNPSGNTYFPRGRGEVVPIDITVVGGSGNFAITKHWYNGYAPGTLTEVGETIDGDTYTRHYEYVQNEVRQDRLYFQVVDNVYKKQNSGEQCRYRWLQTRYKFDGEAGNDYCFGLGMGISGISTGTNGSNVGEVFEFSLTSSGTDPDRVYEFVITEAPSLGGELIPVGPGSSDGEMRFRYTAPGNKEGMDYFTIALKDANDALCSGVSREFRFNVNDESDTCNGSSSSAQGDVIIDNTASSVSAVSSNLKFMTGCDKDQTTIGYKGTGSADENGQGANVINIEDYQIVSRHADPSKLQVYVNALHGEGVVESNLLDNASRRNNFFSDGLHLFDLDHLRDTADWLSGSTGGVPNITPRSSSTDDLDVLEPGTYGTITMQKFLENIRDGKVMYGVVRVVIGLEKGTCEPDCEPDALNGLGVPGDEADIYGFCGETTTSGLCACAPSTRIARDPDHHFPRIRPGDELCLDSTGQPIVLPNDAKIMVKGSLLWDFVDYNATDAEGNPKTIPLDSLPFFPRELYFMVEVPIVINSAYSDDYCGGINYDSCNGRNISDNFSSQVEYINSLTNSKTATSVLSTSYFNFGKVPEVSRDYYEYITGDELTEELYRNLPLADQYHLLMPSGYAEGWADAFKHLQITASTWEGLGYSVPSDAPENEPLTVDWVRHNGNQDIPVYLYSGGLVDMHSHANVSGLVYVPQAFEMEAETENNLRQMIMGSLIVKDGFFIKAKNDSIAIISNFVSSYSSIKTANPIIKRRRYIGSGIERATAGDDLSASDTTNSGDCLFCSGGGGTATSGDGSAGGAGNGAEGPIYPKHWQQIVPN